MGLGRLVQLDAGPFVGRSALLDERARRSRAPDRRPRDQLARRREAVRRRPACAPQLSAAASRAAVPVYRSGRQVGRATTTTWSPVLKKLIALATVRAPHFAEGTALEVEVTVEAVRHRVAGDGRQDAVLQPAAQDRHAGLLNTR